MAAAAGPNTSNFAQSSAFADAVQRARQVFITPVLPLRPEEAGGCCGEAGGARGKAGKGGNPPSSRAVLRTNWSRGVQIDSKGVLIGFRAYQEALRAYKLAQWSTGGLGNSETCVLIGPVACT